MIVTRSQAVDTMTCADLPHAVMIHAVTMPIAMQPYTAVLHSMRIAALRITMVAPLRITLVVMLRRGRIGIGLLHIAGRRRIMTDTMLLHVMNLVIMPRRIMQLPIAARLAQEAIPTVTIVMVPTMPRLSIALTRVIIMRVPARGILIMAGTKLAGLNRAAMTIAVLMPAGLRHAVTKDIAPNSVAPNRAAMKVVLKRDGQNHGVTKPAVMQIAVPNHVQKHVAMVIVVLNHVLKFAVPTGIGPVRVRKHGVMEIVGQSHNPKHVVMAIAVLNRERKLVVLKATADLSRVPKHDVVTEIVGLKGIGLAHAPKNAARATDLAHVLKLVQREIVVQNAVMQPMPHRPI
jgi:hypothetical protein